MAPTVANRWRLRTRELIFGRMPLIMGILNLTPDSFSDGGHFFTIQSAVDQAMRLEDQGADILDIGGESTRPYSQVVSKTEELSRVVPVLEKLQGKISIPISIDTTKADVASAAIDLGAEIINDISGLESDPAMIEIASTRQAGVCVMHMQGTPQTMQDNPAYSDVVAEIVGYLNARDRWLMQRGIAPERICIDPGIGFGKSHLHNLDIIQRAGEFHTTGRPVLIGHSRKGVIAKVLGNKDIDRCFGTIGVSLALALHRIQILRVHDVAANKQALQLFLASVEG